MAIKTLLFVETVKENCICIVKDGTVTSGASTHRGQQVAAHGRLRLQCSVLQWPLTPEPGILALRTNKQPHHVPPPKLGFCELMEPLMLSPLMYEALSCCRAAGMS